MPSQDILDQTFLKIAKEVSLLSKDPTTKVGSVIVSPDKKQISIGYNGFAKGAPETFEMWNNRELKLKLVIHSEENNLLNCPFPTKDCTIYITHQPCPKCIIKLYQAGIKRIVYIEPYTKMGDIDIWNTYASLFNEVVQVPLK